MSAAVDVAPAPTRARTRYPVGWLRALAALSVVTFHAYQHDRTGPEGTWPLDGPAHRLMLGTDLFVDMFFVLSAFVLWLPVARDALDGRTGRPGWLVLLRRVGRLLPLYLVVVLLVWAVTNPSLPGNWEDLLLHLTFTQVYSDTYIFWTNGPAWSLAVEFHVYLVIAMTIPLVHAATRRATDAAARYRAALALPVALVVVGCAYLAWQTVVARPPHEDWPAWFNPLAKAADFGVGMLLAVACAAGVRLGARARLLAAVGSVAALVALALTRPLEGTLTYWWHPMYAVAIAVGLAAIVLHDGPWPAWMSWRPLAWIGGLGYGVYLIHEPVMRLLGHLDLLPDGGRGLGFLLTTAIVAVPTVALAWVSAHTVEEAGGKLAHVADDDGRARDYYPHLR